MYAVNFEENYLIFASFIFIIISSFNYGIITHIYVIITHVYPLRIVTTEVMML